MKKKPKFDPPGMAYVMREHCIRAELDGKRLMEKRLKRKLTIAEYRKLEEKQARKEGLI